MDDDSLSCSAMANVLDIPTVPTTGLQTFAIFINFFFPAMALGVVVLRTAGRLATNAFGWDDGLISVAMLLSLAETVVSYFFIKTNFIGIHVADIPPNLELPSVEASIWNFAVQILYNPILALVKSSVLIFLLRLFGQKTGVRRFIIGLNTLNIAQMVAFFFVIIFQCNPIAFNWDKSIPGGKCVDQRIVFTTTAAWNILTDLLVLGLPLWIFVDLNIPRRTKIALLFIFLLGFIVTITSVVRLVIFVQGLFMLTTSKDPTFNIGFVVSTIEINLALITASAPALRPFIRPRRRGGWMPNSFYGKPPPSSSAAAGGVDPEMGYSYTRSSTGTSSRGGAKLNRGGSRGGRRGGRGRAGSRRPINLRDIRIRTTTTAAGDRALRSQSPRESEEETMTANGIMRVSDVQREIDAVVKDMAVGPGSYGSTLQRNNGLMNNNTTANNGTATNTKSNSNNNSIGTAVTVGATRNLTSAPGRVTSPSPLADAVWYDPDGGSEQFGRMRFPPERFYSESSVYPDLEYRGERDYNEERLSKYGDRRFGVITPKVTTPRRAGWGEGGRPF